MRVTSSLRTTFSHPVDDGLVVVAGVLHHAEKFTGVDVVGPEKVSVAAAAKHGVGWKFAAQFGPSLWNNAGQPGYAFDRIGFGGERG